MNHRSEVESYEDFPAIREGRLDVLLATRTPAEHFHAADQLLAAHPLHLGRSRTRLRAEENNPNISSRPTFLTKACNTGS